MCQKGPDCKFSHDPRTAKDTESNENFPAQVCRKFQAGYCSWWAMCTFSHVRDPKEVEAEKKAEQEALILEAQEMARKMEEERQAQLEAERLTREAAERQAV